MRRLAVPLALIFLLLVPSLAPAATSTKVMIARTITDTVKGNERVEFFLQARRDKPGVATFDLELFVFNATTGQQKWSLDVVGYPISEPTVFRAREDQSVGRLAGTFQLHEIEKWWAEPSGPLHTMIFDIKWTAQDGVRSCESESGDYRAAVVTGTITLDGKQFSLRKHPENSGLSPCGTLFYYTLG